MTLPRDLTDWADDVLEKAGANLAPRAVRSMAQRAAPKPPPGYTPIPGSKHNGYHMQIGGVWRTWYPDAGNALHAAERFSQDEHKREHEAFRATPEGRRHTAREAIAALTQSHGTGGGKAFGDRHVGPLSEHAKQALAHLNEKVRVYEASKLEDDKPPKKGKAAAPKSPAEWQKALGGIELTKTPPANATDVEVHYNPQDPHRSVALTWRNAQGDKVFAYTKEFDRRSAHKKFQRILKLVPIADQARAKMRSAITSAESPRDRDAALVLSIIEHTGLRPGSRDAARKKGVNKKGEPVATFGVSSLLPEHVKENADGSITLDFRGKAGKQNRRDITDPLLVREIKKRLGAAHAMAAHPSKRGLPFLFQSNEQHVRDASKELVGKGFKPKDLRTLWATRTAIETLSMAEPPMLPPDVPGRVKAMEKFIGKISDEVAEKLGNTGGVARRSYIHPSVVATYLNWLGAGDAIPHLFKSADWLLSGAGKLMGRLNDIGECDEAEDDDGGDPEELESYPMDMVRDYAGKAAV